MCECKKNGGTEIKNGIPYWVYLCFCIGSVIWERYAGFQDNGEPREPPKLPEKPIQKPCY